VRTGHRQVGRVCTRGGTRQRCNAWTKAAIDFHLCWAPPPGNIWFMRGSASHVKISTATSPRRSPGQISAIDTAVYIFFAIARHRIYEIDFISDVRCMCCAYWSRSIDHRRLSTRRHWWHIYIDIIISENITSFTDIDFIKTHICWLTFSITPYN